MRFFRIKNFEKYNGTAGSGSRQWVKLYKKIIHDWEYTQLHDSYKAHFLHMILIADAVENRFPRDSVAIRRQLNVSSNVKIEVFEKAGLIEEIVQKTPIRQDKRRLNKTRQDSEKTKKKERIKTSLDIYNDLFLDKFKTKPIIYKKDGVVMATLEKKKSREEIIELLNRFFESEDEFIIKAGYTVGVFSSQINKLIMGNCAEPKSWADKFVEKQKQEEQNAKELL